MNTGSKLFRKLAGAGRYVFLLKRAGHARTARLGGALLGAGFFFLDRILKDGMERQPDECFPRDVPGTNGAARYERCRNEGFMLGAGSENKELVKLVPAMATGALLGKLSAVWKEKGHGPEVLGLTLMIAGGCSNLYDRFTRGYVVDYLSIKKGFLKKYVINLGDAAIFAGACVLALGNAGKWLCLNSLTWFSRGRLGSQSRT